LTDGLDSGEIEKYQGKYTLEIGYDKNDPSAKYWDYVNKGVRGIDSREPDNSPYYFKKLTAPPVMVNAIKSWARQNGITPTANESQKTNLSALQQKRKRIAEVQDPLDSFAYFTARKIKREGLPYTGYFDKPVAEYFGENFAEAIAKAAAFDIRIAIRKFNPAQNA
jgi:peptidoglycan hydrolase-like protein with peptidoglycan-binding domain